MPFAIYIFGGSEKWLQAAQDFLANHFNLAWRAEAADLIIVGEDSSSEWSKVPRELRHKAIVLTGEIASIPTATILKAGFHDVKVRPRTLLALQGTATDALREINQKKES